MVRVAEKRRGEKWTVRSDVQTVTVPFLATAGATAAQTLVLARVGSGRSMKGGKVLLTRHKPERRPDGYMVVAMSS